MRYYVPMSQRILWRLLLFAVFAVALAFAGNWLWDLLPGLVPGLAFFLLVFVAAWTLFRRR